MDNNYRYYYNYNSFRDIESIKILVFCFNKFFVSIQQMPNQLIFHHVYSENSYYDVNCCMGASILHETMHYTESNCNSIIVIYDYCLIIIIQ